MRAAPSIAGGLQVGIECVDRRAAPARQTRPRGASKTPMRGEVHEPFGPPVRDHDAEGLRSERAHRGPEPQPDDAGEHE